MRFGEFCSKVVRHSVSYFRCIYLPIQFELSKLVPDRIYLEHRYKRLMGKKLNLNPPITFNEKLNWMKLYDRNPIYTRLADKYSAREYVKEKIGDEYLVPLLGVWDTVQDIKIDSLPNSFVLKCTHDSGSYIICKDKASFNLDEAKKKLQKALKTNYFYYSREWAYKNIKPRIIAEKYLEDLNDRETRDYKFFLFDGEPRFFYIATDRGIGRTKFDFYDMNFEHLNVRQHYPNASKELHAPKNFNKMVELARVLASGLRHVRVDFYEVNGKIYFSEFTFYNNGGITAFEPDDWDYRFGEWMKI